MREHEFVEMSFLQLSGAVETDSSLVVVQKHVIYIGRNCLW